MAPLAPRPLARLLSFPFRVCSPPGGAGVAGGAGCFVGNEPRRLWEVRVSCFGHFAANRATLRGRGFSFAGNRSKRRRMRNDMGKEVPIFRVGAKLRLSPDLVSPTFWPLHSCQEGADQVGWLKCTKTSDLRFHKNPSSPSPRPDSKSYGTGRAGP